MADLQPKAPSLKPKPASAGGPWWKPGVVIFSEVTGWIVMPLVGALYLGQYLDAKQGTGSLYFLSLTAIAFIISSMGIGLVGVRYIKQMEQEAKSKDTPKDEPTNHPR